jgi:rhodanese-related sulfurtransferase
MGHIFEFANGHPLLAAAVVVSLLAVIFYELRLKSQGVTNVSTSIAVQMINKGATIVDVRKPEEFSRGHIVNARNVPLTDLEAEPDKSLKNSANKVYITVCDNGLSAGRAANALRKSGFESVFSLKGGLAGWRAENLPTVT